MVEHGLDRSTDLGPVLDRAVIERSAAFASSFATANSPSDTLRGIPMASLRSAL